MNERERQFNFLRQENAYLKMRIDQLNTLLSSQAIEPDRWCILTGSPWETAVNSDASEAIQHRNDDELVSAAFRQVKYELFCASVDLLGYSLSITPNRNCIVRPAYFLDDPSKQIEFIYDHATHSYTDVVWSEFLQQHESTYFYWVVEHQCLAGFLTEMFMNMFNQYGKPPRRPKGFHTLPNA